MIETRNRMPLAAGWTEAEWPQFAAVPPASTDACRVYAIGDIHGHADLLAAMHEAIAEDLRVHPAGRARIIHLGDLIDRGPASALVIETVLAATANAPDGVEISSLMGNHDRWMKDFLEDPGIYGLWGPKGGLKTVVSYGIAEPEARLALTASEAAEALRVAFAAAVPPAHRAFLQTLPLWQRQGSYFFVHAGIDPDRTLDDQRGEDMIWIRDRFLASRKHHGPVIVHGHTPHATVENLLNRINVDTGAYYSGTLSCVVLEGTERHLLQVSRRPETVLPAAHQLTEGQSA